MVSIYLLIPLSLMLFVVGIWAVHYAVKSNQFDDLDNAAQRVILDDRQDRRQALSPQANKPTSPSAYGATNGDGVNANNGATANNGDANSDNHGNKDSIDV